MFGREPTLWLHLLAQLITLGVAFGLNFTPAQSIAIAGAAAAVLSVINRQVVTPVATKKPPSGGVAVGVIAIALFALTACASWKPIARTADGIAEALCAQFFSEKQGLSFEDAARGFCSTRDQLEPWIDGVLATKASAGRAALARQKAPTE